MDETNQSKPRPGRPPGSSAETTRARIVEAARGCFGAKGFGATTNKDIATAAGLTAAAIYRYYDSKLDLYMATVLGALEELEPVLRAAAVGQSSGRAELVAVARAAGRLHAERPYLAAFLSSLPVEMQRNPEIAEAMDTGPDPVSALVASAFDRAERAGELAPGVRVEHAVAMVIACNIGLSLWGAAIQQEPSSDAMEAFALLLSGAVFAAGPG
ncbi:MAG: AcrR family transcriptional regulator [Bradymonadia bacterium]|jgi:AcrR family transcriptional regulator